MEVTKEALKAVEKAIEEFNSRTKTLSGLRKAKNRINSNWFTKITRFKTYQIRETSNKSKYSSKQDKIRL